MTRRRRSTIRPVAETNTEVGIGQSALLGELLDLCGRTQAGTRVAQEMVSEAGKKALEEAKKAAERGVLSTAAEYLSVSGLSPDEQMGKLNELAVSAQRYLQGRQEKGELSPVATEEALKATAVFKATAGPLRPAK